MIITKDEVRAFEELTETDNSMIDNTAGVYFYHGEPMSRWLLLRFRFAMWKVKTFRLFKKPIVHTEYKKLTDAEFREVMQGSYWGRDDAVK